MGELTIAENIENSSKTIILPKCVFDDETGGPNAEKLYEGELSIY